jgi:hypothetical protein
LVNELSQFWSDRPALLHQPVSNPTTDEDKQRNAAWDKYWREAESNYGRLYKDRVLGIVREYKTKGVQTGFLEAGAENHVFGGFPFGVPGSQNCWQDELCQLRELAYHVDAHDQVILLPDF